MIAPILLDFHDQPSATKALKKVAQYMQRAGQPVVSSNFDPKVRRSSNVSFREALLTLASGQTVTLRVTQSGDVFQVLLNGSVKPIKNASDQIKAIGEIAALAEANQAAFQKKQARVKVDLPKGIKTAAPRMEVALQSRLEELDAQIAERKTQVNELKVELGEPILDAAAAPAEPVLDNAGSGDQTDIAAALELAGSIVSGTVLDSADTAAAVATLRNALDIVETNSVINMGEGNLEQAELERSNAESFRAALAILDAAEPPKIQEPEEPEPSKAGDPAIKAVDDLIDEGSKQDDPKVPAAE